MSTPTVGVTTSHDGDSLCGCVPLPTRFKGCNRRGTTRKVIEVKFCVNLDLQNESEIVDALHVRDGGVAGSRVGRVRSFRGSVLRGRGCLHRVLHDFICTVCAFYACTCVHRGREPGSRHCCTACLHIVSTRAQCTRTHRTPSPQHPLHSGLCVCACVCRRCRVQTCLPNWMWCRSEHDMLRYCPGDIAGVTSPQLYLKVPGVWTVGLASSSDDHALRVPARAVVGVGVSLIDWSC